MKIKIFASLIFFILVNGNLQSQIINSEISNFEKAFQHQKNAIEFYKNKNFQKALNEFSEAKKFSSNDPNLIYNLAAVNSILKNENDALKFLNQLAKMKLVFHPENDSDFVSLWQNENFKKTISNFEFNAQKVKKSKIAFKLDEKDLITEGVAYNSKEDKFYVSSVHKRKILEIDSNGKARDFISEAENGIFGVLGISVDAKRNILWVTTAAPVQIKNYNKNDLGKSAVFKFDLQNGKLIKKYFAPQGNHFFGDLILAKNGDVYISNSRDKSYFKIDAEKDSLEYLIDAGNFVSPQGLALSTDEKFLFVADYALGIIKFDLQTKNSKLISSPDSICTLGTDGLYFYKNNLIAIQNGLNPNRVVKFKLNESLDEILSQEILEANTEFIDDPTLGVIVNDEFYFIANSQWNKVDRNGTPQDLENWNDPVILKLNLK